MVVVMVVVMVIVAVMIVIPSVIVLYTAVLAVPIACIELLTIVVRTYPARTLIRGPAPIALMPAIVSRHRIPVAPNPQIVRAWLRRLNMDYARRRRRTNPDSK
jgi:hypothetical protein